MYSSTASWLTLHPQIFVSGDLKQEGNIYLWYLYNWPWYHKRFLPYLVLAYSMSQGVVQLNLDTNFWCKFASLCEDISQLILYLDFHLLFNPQMEKTISVCEKMVWVCLLLFWKLTFTFQVCEILEEFVKLGDSASSFHWLSSSIFSYWLFVRLSRISDISSHLHYMRFPSIQTLYFLWGYDPGIMSLSTYLLLLSWAQFTVV